MHPRRWPKKLRRCGKHDCPRERDKHKIWVVAPESGRRRLVAVNPWYCAVQAVVFSDKDVRRYFRKGKDLVLSVEDVSPDELGCHAVKDAHGDFVTTCVGDSVCGPYNYALCSKFVSTEASMFVGSVQDFMGRPCVSLLTRNRG